MISLGNKLLFKSLGSVGFFKKYFMLTNAAMIKNTEKLKYYCNLK